MLPGGDGTVGNGQEPGNGDDEQRGRLPGSDVFRLFEDSRGDIWISIAGAVRNLVQWERASESFHVHSEEEGLPHYSPPTAYREDAAGNLWLGFYEGGLARYRDGLFRLFTQADGITPGPVRALYSDHAGRLWAATGEGGVARLDDPQAEQPHFITYTVADGLPHNVINKIVRDSHGFLWFCTDDGLSRFDGYEFTNYGTNEGLPHSVVIDFLETRDDDYWVDTNGGLCKFNPNGFPTRVVIYADQLPTDAHREPMFTVFKGEDDVAR